MEVPEIAALPVGDPFSSAEWSLEAGEATRTVTPDRLVAIHCFKVRTWAADGKEVWTYDASNSTPEIRVLQDTVAVIAQGKSGGEGLDKARKISQVTLLSLDDETIVSEVEVPDSKISSHQRTMRGRRRTAERRTHRGGRQRHRLRINRGWKTRCGLTRQ